MLFSLYALLFKTMTADTTNTTNTTNTIDTTNTNTMAYPPIPPANMGNEDDFVPGEFRYLDNFSREFVRDAYNVISRNEWWGSFRRTLLSRGVDNETGFMWSTDPFYREIMNAIASTEVGSGHSGTSIGFCMRAMQQIALLGEREYRRLQIQAQIRSAQETREVTERRRFMEMARQIIMMEQAMEQADATDSPYSVREQT